jgi:oligopeptidase B
VDVINTMYDESLPLTVGEFLEWGNPKKEEEYRYIRTYSPYENLRDAKYPDLLVKTSYNDSQVMYWEPAKYVAKMREVGKPSSLVFKTNMAGGHGGSSGRFDVLRERAFDFAWLFQKLK